MQKLSSAYSSFSCNLNSQQNYFYSRIPNLIRLKLYWLHISNIAYFSFPANLYFYQQHPLKYFLFFIKRGAMFFTQTSPLGSITYLVVSYTSPHTSKPYVPAP